MMRWISAVALILYLSLLVTPQVSSAHAPHLMPLADSQLLAVSPLTGQASLTSEQDGSDDNDNSLPVTATEPLLLLSLAVNSPAVTVFLLPLKVAHPVRAPPYYSLA